MHYLCILLNIIKGPKSFKELRTVVGTVYPSFKDACYSFSLLDDNKEFIDAINEVSYWASGVYFQRIFVGMLVSNSLTRPLHV